MKYIVTAYLVDMAEEVQDVIGVVHLVASSPEEAGQKAAEAFSKTGLAQEGGKYRIQVVVVTPLVGTGPEIIKPRIELPKGVDLSGAARR